MFCTESKKKKKKKKNGHLSVFERKEERKKEKTSPDNPDTQYTARLGGGGETETAR